jgi:hypothetical protein
MAGGGVLPAQAASVSADADRMRTERIEAMPFIFVPSLQELLWRQVRATRRCR